MFFQCHKVLNVHRTMHVLFLGFVLKLTPLGFEILVILQELTASEYLHKVSNYHHYLNKRMYHLKCE